MNTLFISFFFTISDILKKEQFGFNCLFWFKLADKKLNIFSKKEFLEIPRNTIPVTVAWHSGLIGRELLIKIKIYFHRK